MIAQSVKGSVEWYRLAEEQTDLYAAGRLDEYFDGIRHHGKPISRWGNTPMAPLPFLSPLYHGSLEWALDISYEPYPVKEKGLLFGTATEAVNSLAAIKKAVYDDRRYTLDEVYAACENNFDGSEGLIMKKILWNCPKWGNDDDYVDSIAKDVLEFGLLECTKYKTYFGGQVLGGIHQPHPVPTGKGIMATPDGRAAGEPVAVTLTPESGTMRKGPTAALSSAAKLDPTLIQWNFCVMVNYFSSVFKGNGGKEIFKSLLQGYFKAGGLQHQPNVTDVEELKRAQLNPEAYKDLIVRLWGVSAHFVDLPRELQDEMIARFS
jgi:formate C-acetyltransferase